MTTAVPQYHEIRMTLADLDTAFREFIGDATMLNIGETMRLMLADYFYGQKATTIFQSYTIQDRTLVWPMSGQTLFGLELDNAIDAYGELFWSLADVITLNALAVTPQYNHRPNECFYKFFPDSRELVVYVPVLDNFTYTTPMVALDGRAVITTCSDTLPSWLSPSAHQATA